MTQSEWNRVVDVLWNGATSVIDTITDMRMKDELPERIAVEAGSRLDAARALVAQLTDEGLEN